MRIYFKLTDEQTRRATEFATPYIPAPQLNRRYCGNLLPAQVVGPHFNADQKLNVCGNYLMYEGQRHPLHQDGGLNVIADIAGYPAVADGLRDGFSKLEVYLYETSTQQLEWYETLGSYMITRASDAEMLKWLSVQGSYDVEKLLEEAGRVFGELCHIPPSEYPDCLRPKSRK